MAQDPEVLLVSTLQVAAQNWGAFDWPARQWESTSAQIKEARESSLAARKQLAENTKQLKKSVKTLETVGGTLPSENTEENVSATVKAIEALAKSCRVTVKAYQGKRIIDCFT